MRPRMKLKHCGLLPPFPSCASGSTAATDTVDVFSHSHGMVTWLLSGAQLEPWLSLLFLDILGGLDIIRKAITTSVLTATILILET